MKKTAVWKVLVIVLAAGCAAGCGQKAVEPKEEEEREKLVLWSYFETDAQLKALDNLMEGFNLSQDKYEAVWEYVPMTEFTKKLAMAYTEKSLPDLALIDNPNMPACIKMGMFEDITEFLQKMGVEDNYYPSLLETVSYEGRMYGLPADCNNVGLIYNKQLFSETGLEPPKTWEELETAAAALTTEERSGFLMSCVEGEQGAFQILPWILSTGEDKEMIGGDGTVKALTFIDTLVEKKYMTSNCINLSQTDVARVFLRGEAAMMENGPWVFPMLDEAGIDYGVSTLPVDQQSSVIVGGENLGILKGKNVEGAKLFLEYYNRDPIMEEFCRSTSVLPTKPQIQLREGSNLQVFREQMEGAVVRTSIPCWNTLSGRLTSVLYQIVAGEKSPEQAAKELQVEE